jgi:DNA adenine methylase
MKTPIRYAGGKSKAYNIITEQIPQGLFHSSPERIISPFMGGGVAYAGGGRAMKRKGGKV